MGVKIQIFLLLGIIATIVGGTLYLAEQEGLIPAEASSTLRTIGAGIPYLGEYMGVSDVLPADETNELQELQETRAQEEKWENLKSSQEELKKAENELNSERQRLSQWEGELERREQAIKEREEEFDNKESRYKMAVKFYLQMKPNAAAQILSKQDDILVIEIFRRMPERNVSSILSQMDPAVAGAIMRKMAR